MVAMAAAIALAVTIGQITGFHVEVPHNTNFIHFILLRKLLNLKLP